MIWFVLVLAVYNIVFSFIMSTKNIQSAMVFKVIPFTLGSGSLLYVLNYFNII